MLHASKLSHAKAVMCLLKWIHLVYKLAIKANKVKKKRGFFIFFFSHGDHRRDEGSIAEMT